MRFFLHLYRVLKQRGHNFALETRRQVALKFFDENLRCATHLAF